MASSRLTADAAGPPPITTASRHTAQARAKAASLFLVLPGRGLWARDDAGDIRIDAIGRGRPIGAPRPFEPTRCFLLLFFLARALARAFVLRRSGFLHEGSDLRHAVASRLPLFYVAVSGVPEHRGHQGD